ncbi:hypothetical protein NYV55_25890 [Escherichia coli]|nr:hypothetical protein [Escherichia coli]MCS6611566.1 hypothetical protein [Escherichia coli]MCS6620697.1 hypothetical protein [Escherichia coli]
MEFTYPGANKSHLQSSNSDVVAAAAISITATEMKTILPDDLTPGKYKKNLSVWGWFCWSTTS